MLLLSRRNGLTLDSERLIDFKNSSAPTHVGKELFRINWIPSLVSKTRIIMFQTFEPRFSNLRYNFATEGVAALLTRDVTTK